MAGVAAILLVIGVAIGSALFPMTETETISEIIIEASGVNGGAAFCEGNLSTPMGCTGGGIIQSTFLNTTTYVLPPLPSNGEILKAAFTTITVQGVLKCSNATTYTTTVDYNSTSGYGRIDWSWVATSCSVTTYRSG